MAPKNYASPTSTTDSTGNKRVSNSSSNGVIRRVDAQPQYAVTSSTIGVIQRAPAQMNVAGPSTSGVIQRAQPQPQSNVAVASTSGVIKRARASQSDYAVASTSTAVNPVPSTSGMSRMSYQQPDNAVPSTSGESPASTSQKRKPKSADTELIEEEEPWKGPTGIFQQYNPHIADNNRRKMPKVQKPDEAAVQDRIVHEMQRHEDYMDEAMGEFPENHRLRYNEMKVRSVCRVDMYKAMWAAQMDALGKPVNSRSKNNHKSLLSRYKQKMTRTSDGISVLYLRNRVEEYKRRIQEVMNMANTATQSNQPMVWVPPTPPITPPLDGQNQTSVPKPQQQQDNAAMDCDDDDDDDDDVQIIEHNYAAPPPAQAPMAAPVDNRTEAEVFESKLHAFASLALSGDTDVVDNVFAYKQDK